MSYWHRQIFTAVVLGIALSFAHVVDAATLSVEAIQKDVRRVTTVDDDGTRRETFERRDNYTCAWFPARLDPSTDKYVYTADGDLRRRAKTVEIQNFQRSLNRENWRY